MYINIGLGLEPIAWRHAPVIWNLAKWNSVKWNELEQFLDASASRWFVSVSWAFLFLLFGKQQEIVTKPSHRLIDVKNQ